MPDETELIVDGDMAWGDYKQIVSNATDFETRAALIEKYVRAREGSIDNVPVRKVIGALRRMLTEASDPNG